MVASRAWSDEDRRWMRRALALAWRAQGRVAPNPAVGAVLVREGEVVGEGATRPPGGSHAEIVALQQAGERARGATLYVTLEPCAHYGRTPPCVEALVAAGVRRVVVALLDPYPEVCGRGLARLRDAGIEVEVGLEADAAALVNAGYLKRLSTGLPEVTAKYAMTLDGRIATRSGHSRWITGELARREAHRLRDQHDAVLVGVGTVLADDPLLTVRLPPEEAGEGGPHHPLRVVVDSRARTPATAAMLHPDTPGRTLIACTASAPAERLAALEAAGAEVLILPGSEGGVDLVALLRALGERGVNRVLVEGGGRLLGRLFDLGLVDQVVAFIAPVLVGGCQAPGPVGGRGVATMDQAWRLQGVELCRLGPDVMVAGRLTVPPVSEVA
ncbi:bifunctional diaminohydroxyphosphoribosylaminopyrimidine deaminase/5-amino-6-(5-phosphoribosylamino)uracil reductase RibD [Thermomicrobiaceae bacterium CFH 74404]|uniref:Riboflavin biosynthesis protein RibD n=1 Tax=Thermalbibacter longus TaxID=2951981 RepID=A0AA41WE96_9BACT|nr:bifunctional diaminohydroxyphosphoribosylaminopyrimidine deaminase/5-amino-6-(5-phosphoribosylamino)uracil reductase RibD [Thermalbibacter longus]MCM8748430.1 bifunctional diaminohydroxyphosphoribosylaminopyrimidine deaminase/5-amino-6-(5-phosphoribosylamino)uracil reductase RibD [Thermalbibacter longus]